MKKFIIAISLLLTTSIVGASCIPPIKPIPSIKPIWCHGQWTQILVEDKYGNCRWVEVCIEN